MVDKKENNIAWCPECGDSLRIVNKKICKPNEQWDYYCIGCDKHFSIESKSFADWFDRNMIYCEQTHSFVHRLSEKLGFDDYRKAQNLAFEVMAEMRKEYEEQFKNGRTK